MLSNSQNGSEFDFSEKLDLFNEVNILILFFFPTENMVIILYMNARRDSNFFQWEWSH